MAATPTAVMQTRATMSILLSTKHLLVPFLPSTSTLLSTDRSATYVSWKRESDSQESRPVGLYRGIVEVEVEEPEALVEQVGDSSGDQPVSIGQTVAQPCIEEPEVIPARLELAGL